MSMKDHEYANASWPMHKILCFEVLSVGDSILKPCMDALFRKWPNILNQSINICRTQAVAISQNRIVLTD